MNYATFEAEQSKRLGITSKPHQAAPFICGHGVEGAGNCAECRALVPQYNARRYDFSNDPLLTA